MKIEYDTILIRMLIIFILIPVLLFENIKYLLSMKYNFYNSIIDNKITLREYCIN